MKLTGRVLLLILLVCITASFIFTYWKSMNLLPISKKNLLLPTISITPSIIPSPTFSPTPTPFSQYPLHKHIFATMFWVGEKATHANDYIPNMASAWDVHWLDHFGGIDNPYSREGYYPKGFIPKENPFYFALPYDDLGDHGRKANAVEIPWYDPNLFEDNSLVKNRWVRLVYQKHVCYAQWEDVGPFETDDFEYVFGGQQPREKRAGIDLSPAVRDCLHMVTNGYIDWQFIDEMDVPSGPWKEIITTSQTDW